MLVLERLSVELGVAFARPSDDLGGQAEVLRRVLRRERTQVGLRELRRARLGGLALVRRTRDALPERLQPDGELRLVVLPAPLRKHLLEEREAETVDVLGVRLNGAQDILIAPHQLQVDCVCTLRQKRRMSSKSAILRGRRSLCKVQAMLYHIHTIKSTEQKYEKRNNIERK